jgi:hypothetical protein
MTKKDVLDAAARMVDQRFVRWLKFIQDHEAILRHGQIVNEDEPDDSGGLTFDGIDRASHPHFPYANPTPKDVVKAYLADWVACGADKQESPIGEVMANYQVNMGPGGLHSVLTIAGPRMKGESAQNYAQRIIKAADARYAAIAAHNVRLRKFLHGWLNRDTDLKKDIQTA